MEEVEIFPAVEFKLRPIPHEISYRTIPGSSLRSNANKDLTLLNVWQEGCIYPYGIPHFSPAGIDYYWKAKVKHGQLLAGLLSKHPWAKHVTLNPAKGVEFMVSALEHKAEGFLDVRGSQKNAEESLGYLEGSYAILMACAHNTKGIHDREKLEAFLKNLTRSKSPFPIKPVLLDYFLKLFLRRQGFIKDNIRRIAEHNRCSEEHIVNVTIKRTDILPLPTKDPRRLILNGDTTDIYPVEMVLYLNHLNVPDALDKPLEKGTTDINP